MNGLILWAWDPEEKAWRGGLDGVRLLAYDHDDGWAVWWISGARSVTVILPDREVAARACAAAVQALLGKTDPVAAERERYAKVETERDAAQRALSRAIEGVRKVRALVPTDFVWTPDDFRHLCDRVTQELSGAPAPKE